MATILDTLITDRTLEDVQAGNEKGIYRAEDLNRVERAIVFVAQLLEEAGFRVAVDAKVNWTMIDVPTTGQTERILENLRMIRSAIPLSDETPKVPEDMVLMTYEEANDIEKILLDVGSAANKISSTYRHCGVPICGLEDLIR